MWLFLGALFSTWQLVEMLLDAVRGATIQTFLVTDRVQQKYTHEFWQIAIMPWVTFRTVPLQ
jgi:hypothetical protein